MGTYWRRMSEEEQTQYRVLFRAALVETIIDWLDAYDGQTFEIQSIRETGRNTEIRMRFVTRGGLSLGSTWVARETTGIYLIRDVRVSGLSLIADFRGKYRRIIEDEGLERFFEILEADTAELRAKQD